MHKKIVFGCFLTLITFGSVFLSGCTNRSNNYSLSEISQIEYAQMPYSQTAVSGIILPSETYVTEQIYNKLSQVKYDKTRPKKDFWTQKPITYKPPNTYDYIVISLQSGRTHTYYFFGGMVFPSLTAYEYSTAGSTASADAYHYLYNRDYNN